MARALGIESLQSKLRVEWAEQQAATAKASPPKPTQPWVSVHKRDIVGRSLLADLLSTRLLKTIEALDRRRVSARLNPAQTQIPYVDAATLYPGGHRHDRLSATGIKEMAKRRVRGGHPMYADMFEERTVSLGAVTYLVQQKPPCESQRRRPNWHAIVRLPLLEADPFTEERRTLRQDNGLPAGDGRRAGWVDLIHLEGKKSVLESETFEADVIGITQGALPGEVTIAGLNILPALARLTDPDYADEPEYLYTADPDTDTEPYGFITDW